MFGPLLCEKISKQILAGIRILSPVFGSLHDDQEGNNIPWFEEGLCTMGLDISHIHGRKLKIQSDNDKHMRIVLKKIQTENYQEISCETLNKQNWYL